MEEENAPVRGGDTVFDTDSRLVIHAGYGSNGAPGGDIIFRTEGVERLRITHDGRFVVASQGEVSGAENLFEGFKVWLTATGVFDALSRKSR